MLSLVPSPAASSKEGCTGIPSSASESDPIDAGTPAHLEGGVSGGVRVGSESTRAYAVACVAGLRGVRGTTTEQVGGAEVGDCGENQDILSRSGVVGPIGTDSRVRWLGPSSSMSEASLSCFLFHTRHAAPTRTTRPTAPQANPMKVVPVTRYNNWVLRSQYLFPSSHSAGSSLTSSSTKTAAGGPARGGLGGLAGLGGAGGLWGGEGGAG